MSARTDTKVDRRIRSYPALLEIESLQDRIGVDTCLLAGQVIDADVGKCEQERVGKKFVSTAEKLRALRMFASGGEISAIKAQTGIGKQLLYYLLNRSNEIAVNGEPLGLRAIFPYQRAAERSTSYDSLKQERPRPGSLEALFKAHPSLHLIMREAVLEGRLPGSAKVLQGGLSASLLFEVFSSHCREVLKIPPGHYPFNSYSMGKVALQRWLGKLRKEKLKIDAFRSAEAAARNQWSDPSATLQYYEEVQVDGYWADVDWTINTGAATGAGQVANYVKRIWIIVVAESRSRCPLGYSVAYGHNYSHGDILRALKSAITPWRRRKLTINGAAYEASQRLPTATPGLAYVCWQRMLLDNAKAHLSTALLHTASYVIGCTPVYGPVAAPDNRPIIEGLYALLEKTGFGKIQGIGLVLQEKELLDVVDLLVTGIASSVCPGTTQSRIGVLEEGCLQTAALLRKVPESKRTQLLKYDMVDIATIRMDGSRPVIRYKNAKYFASSIRQSFDHADSDVLVFANSADVRALDVYLLGSSLPLGIFDIERRFGQVAHSVETRRAAKRHASTHGFSSKTPNIILNLRQHLEGKKKLSASESRKLARIVGEMRSDDRGADTPPSGSPPKNVQSESKESRPHQALLNALIPMFRDLSEDDS